MTVRSITQVTYTLIYIATRFLYYLSVYVNLSKNSSRLRLKRGHPSKADAKVRTFFEITNFFGTFFNKYYKNNVALDQYQEPLTIYTLLYIRAKGLIEEHTTTREH